MADSDPMVTVTMPSSVFNDIFRPSATQLPGGEPAAALDAGRAEHWELIYDASGEVQLHALALVEEDGE